MKEKPPDKPHLRVIEGGKRDLRELAPRVIAADPRISKIDKVRTLSPALDRYLKHRPEENPDVLGLLREITDEFWKLPGGGADTRNAAYARTEAKLGPWPRTASYHWLTANDAQVAWDEAFTLEYACGIAEQLDATAEHERKLNNLERHLDKAAERHYSGGDE